VFGRRVLVLAPQIAVYYMFWYRQFPIIDLL
jgi:hypothetical protein